MQDVLQGFATIWFVIGVGVLLTHRGILDERTQLMLGHVAFVVALPAQMFVTLAAADIRRVFASNVIVSFLAVVATVAMYLAIAQIAWKPTKSHLVIGSFGSAYLNAGNLGLPIAAYVLKDTTWVAPILLMQVGFLQPLGLSLLDVLKARREGRKPSILRQVTTPLRNPMTLGMLAGLAVNLLDIQVPRPVLDPIQLIAGMAVPSMLLAFGVSLRLGGLPRRGEQLAETLVICGLKLLFHPTVAILLAVFVFHLDPEATLAVAIMAALPTAQNVFVFAMRYQQPHEMARDVIAITTIASIPVVTAVAAVVGLLV